jgi:hypothetical protein
MEKKNTWKIRICIDLRNLNKATMKDKYPMLIANMLINSVSGNRMISFLDSNAGYNKIFMAEEDVSKTAFHCLGFVGLFEWVVMAFSLKNAGATYQRMMNLIFHDLLGFLLEIYIDEVVIKSTIFDDHMADLRMAFERMKKYGLRMNPMKCVFRVSANRFLGFIVHQHGIQVDTRKVESIKKIGELTFKKDVQKLLGKDNYLRCIISNLAGKIESFFTLVWIKNEKEFTWWHSRKRLLRKLKSI